MKTSSPLPCPDPLNRHGRRPSRWFVVATIGLLGLLTLGMIGPYLLLRHSGPLRVGVIAGSSMEPALRGPRLELVCTNCQSINSWTYDAWNPDREVRCRFCREYLDTSDPKTTQGETVLYVPMLRRKRLAANASESRDDPSGPLESDRVGRWDIVVLETPQDESLESSKASQIKRVVGLPGETIRIDQGRIYADGKEVLPTLIEFMHQAVLMANWEVGSKYPASKYPASKYPDSKYPAKTLPEFLSWVAAPIDNELPINAHDSHQRIAVRDIGIAMRIAQPQSNWSIKLQLRHGDQRIPIELSCYEKNAQVTLMAPETQKETGSWQSPSAKIGSIPSWQPIWINLVVLSGRLIVLDERQERWSVALGPIQEGLGWTEMSLVEPQGLIDRCMIYRGLHYRGVRDTQEQEFAAAEGWIVLGDNASISEDSRYWEQPRVVRDALRGILEPPATLMEGLVKQLPR